MTIERYLRAIAGSLILASVLLAYYHSKYWLFFTGFVGLFCRSAPRRTGRPGRYSLHPTARMVFPFSIPTFEILPRKPGGHRGCSHSNISYHPAASIACSRPGSKAPLSEQTDYHRDHRCDVGGSHFLDHPGF